MSIGFFFRELQHTIKEKWCKSITDFEAINSDCL